MYKNFLRHSPKILYISISLFSHNIMPKKAFRRRRVGTAKKALKEVRKLKKQLKPELKFADSGTITVLSVAVGLVARRNDMAGGTEIFQRIGNAIRIMTWSIKGFVIANVDASALVYQQLRLMVFIDKQTVEASTPAVLELLSTSNVISFNNLDKAKRFRILYDRVFVMDKEDWQTTTFFKKSFRLNMPQRYSSPVQSDIEKNGIYVLIVGNSATLGPTIIYQVRTIFTDV